MIFQVYACLATLATLLAAVGCWVPVAVIGLGMGYILLRQEIKAMLGSLRRKGVLPDRRLQTAR